MTKVGSSSDFACSTVKNVYLCRARYYGFGSPKIRNLQQPKQRGFCRSASFPPYLCDFSKYLPRNGDKFFLDHTENKGNAGLDKVMRCLRMLDQMKSASSSSRSSGPKLSDLNFCESELLDLKAHPAYDEAWLEQLLCKRPNLLGLGDIKVVSCQRRLTKGGRLDMIAENAKLQQAFVIEIMLGQLDESHIIRALQYCLREKARPDRKDWEIAAVLVAERVLGTRYRGVVQLLTEELSMTMPIIVIELSALRLGKLLTLKITRVFDGTEEVPSETTTNKGEQKTVRAEWITKASAESVELAEQFGPLLKKIDNSLTLTYKREFIGIAAGNRPENFFVIHPKKQFVRMSVKTPNAASWSKRLAKVGFDLLDGGPEKVRFRLTASDFKKNRKLLRDLCNASYANWFS